MTCFNLINLNQCLGTDNTIDNEQNKNELNSTIFTSSGSLLFAHFPLDKEDLHCLIIVSPNLYCFQGERADYICGCLIIGNKEQYIELNLNSNMFHLNSMDYNNNKNDTIQNSYNCHISIPSNTRVS